MTYVLFLNSIESVAKRTTVFKWRELSSVITFEILKAWGLSFSREMNGRLRMWSFCRLQAIVKYKATLNRMKVIYVNVRGASSLCPM